MLLVFRGPWTVVAGTAASGVGEAFAGKERIGEIFVC